MRRPDDQLRRMLEQTLVPPTSVEELDPDTIDRATSRWGSVHGNLAETYAVNSALTPTRARRIADREEIKQLTDFYFSTAMSGYDRLADQASRWLLPASSFPVPLQVLLQPVLNNPALTAALFTVEVLIVHDGRLWRLVPNRPGAVLEGEYTAQDAARVAEGLVQSDTDLFTPTMFLVNHLGRASYLTGDRAFRNSAMSVGMVLGAAWEAARGANLPMASTYTFLDHSVNESLRCDGVERAAAAVVLLPTEIMSAPTSAMGVPATTTNNGTAAPGGG